ncbi:MAG: inner membrane CreD family protein [Bryobacterales bacterium]|nr:inner membrane CreD family protein [Bryobacterales bacterium]
MTRRILAIVAIYLATCVAWSILGTSVFVRTSETSRELGGKVESIWGTRQVQASPSAWFWRPLEPAEADETKPDGKGGEAPRPRRAKVNVPLESSRIEADLQLAHRRKGLAWYSTYTVAFAGAYRFVNPSSEEQEVFVEFALPEGQALYDEFRATFAGDDVSNQIRQAKLLVSRRVPAGGAIEFSGAYRSRGLDQWKYRFQEGVSQVNDFLLTMTTNFDRIDFPPNSLSATGRQKQGDGWRLEWRYAKLLSSLNIAMDMPAKLQPGELVGRITFFAPVSLMFFFFLLFIITVLRRIEIHPMNYFFVAAAFFAFHLLLAYTADLIDIHLAFAISSVVSVFLVISYLRLVVGIRFALREAGILQFLYLVGFSYTFFLKGYSALCVTVASIVTLFVVMQLTGRIRWAELFASNGNRSR